MYRALLLWAHHEKAGSLGKRMMPGKEKAAGKEETKQEMDGTHKRSRRLSLRERSRAVGTGHRGHCSSMGSPGVRVNSTSHNINTLTFENKVGEQPGDHRVRARGWLSHLWNFSMRRLYLEVRVPSKHCLCYCEMIYAVSSQKSMAIYSLEK